MFPSSGTRSASASARLFPALPLPGSCVNLLLQNAALAPARESVPANVLRSSACASLVSQSDRPVTPRQSGPITPQVLLPLSRTPSLAHLGHFLASPTLLVILRAGFLSVDPPY